MTTTGTYAINGTDLLTQPTIGHWVGREVLGYDGNAHPVYPGIRDFEMRWEVIPVDSFQQLQNFYDAIRSAGTCVVNLPIYNNAAFVFDNYSGCTLTEPTTNGGYFAEDGYLTDVVLVVKRVRT